MISRRRGVAAMAYEDVGLSLCLPMAWRRTKRALALSLCNDRIVKCVAG